MSKTILIVEDNELNMKLFNDLLQAHGYNTLQIKDGARSRSDHPSAAPWSHSHGYSAT